MKIKAKLPEPYQIIGVIVADVENIDGDILWSDWILEKLDVIQRKDILKDIAGLAERRYKKALISDKSS